MYTKINLIGIKLQNQQSTNVNVSAASNDTGLLKTLRSCFPEDWSRILTCAYYLACEGNALCHIEQWSMRSRHPFKEKFADQRVSKLLGRITPSLQQDFYRQWITANHSEGYFALDITSVSSYSELIDYIRWGYNRDSEKLPQINILMLTSQETRLPICYRVLSGAIKDVSTLKESLGNLEFLGSRPLHLVMDKGFFSGANVDAMYDT